MPERQLSRAERSSDAGTSIVWEPAR
ncbi:MAG: hypothetical protein K0S65_3698, partial [Labilithrix sp.]|nr:hypothetical protein [Labilithrix sp.]